jgi:Tol biopolymer transport system component
VDLPLDQNHWDLSPDGSRIALLADGEAGRIRILSLADGSTHDVTVDGWSGFQSMDWSANGKGLYVSSQRAMHSTLLYIDLEGHAHVLRQQMGHFQAWGIPSPNGRYLAFLEWTAVSNVWMIENF